MTRAAILFERAPVHIDVTGAARVGFRLHVHRALLMARHAGDRCMASAQRKRGLRVIHLARLPSVCRMTVRACRAK